MNTITDDKKKEKKTYKEKNYKEGKKKRTYDSDYSVKRKKPKKLDLLVSSSDEEEKDLPQINFTSAFFRKKIRKLSPYKIFEMLESHFEEKNSEKEISNFKEEA